MEGLRCIYLRNYQGILRRYQRTMSKRPGNAHLKNRERIRSSLHGDVRGRGDEDGPIHFGQVLGTSIFLARTSEGMARQRLEPAGILRAARTGTEAVRKLARQVQGR